MPLLLRSNLSNESMFYFKYTKCAVLPQVQAVAADNTNCDSFILAYCTNQQAFKKWHYIKPFSAGAQKND